MKARRRRSPDRPRSTASDRRKTGRATGSRPRRAAARRRVGPTGTDIRKPQPMPPRKSSSRASFVERHGLWTPAQERAARDVEAAIKKHKLELIRFSFADQHGVLRG